MHDILTLMNKNNKGFINTTDPVFVLFGEVTSQSPLEILVEQRLPLDEDQLVLTRAVRDYEIEMTVDHLTETDNGPAAHTHQYKGKKKFLIHNGLVVGDRVKLLRVQGGQQYVVFDKE
ncbi:DUF2577 domain-containing protein [Viridibacillus arvi]|uniref:DUF2577 domain-containing protein n=1 Tax=Viridibacillus arvi TaxID=263475 RepID=UPI003D26B059